MIGFFIRDEFTRNPLSKLMALIASPVLKRVKNRVDPRKYNGAVLLGLNNIVIKSHGGADQFGFYFALEQAYHEVNAGVITLLEDYLAKNKHILDEKTIINLLNLKT